MTFHKGCHYISLISVHFLTMYTCHCCYLCANNQPLVSHCSLNCNAQSHKLIPWLNAINNTYNSIFIKLHALLFKLFSQKVCCKYSIHHLMASNLKKQSLFFLEHLSIFPSSALKPYKQEIAQWKPHNMLTTQEPILLPFKN